MSPREGQEEPLRRLSKLITSFMSRPDAAPFLEPVDWRGLELFDYPEIITKMMDLGTIKRKLERKQYNTAWECAQDIKLVWSNCMLYNAEGSELWNIAKSFNRKFEDKFRKIRQEFDVGENQEEEGQEEEQEQESDEEVDDNNSEGGDNGGEISGTESASKGQQPSLDARAQLASNLILLHGIELGHVMAMLERECPQALESLAGDDGDDVVPEKVEIVLDKLDAGVFAKISQYAAERASGRNKGMALEDLALEDVSGKRKRKR